MKLVTFKIREYLHFNSRIGVVKEDFVVDLTSTYAALLQSKGRSRPYEIASTVIPFDMIRFLEGGDESTSAAREAVSFISRLEIGERKGVLGENLAYPLSSVKLLPPIPKPGRILCMGKNYPEHARETGDEVPKTQRIFSKLSTSIVGHEDPIVRPRIVSSLDHELELAVVIGKRAKYVRESEAYDYVAGYTILNDVTARDIASKERQLGVVVFGKGMDSFGPMGPCITTRDEIKDPHMLKMTLKVNGKVRQNAISGEMYYKIPQVLAYTSQLGLNPGDLISMGTPAGVAVGMKPDPAKYYLKEGDVVECEIQGIGVLRNHVIDEK